MGYRKNRNGPEKHHAIHVRGNAAVNLNILYIVYREIVILVRNYM